MMRMLSLVSLMVLAVTILELSVPARGDEAPVPQGQGASQDVKLTPEMQAMLGQLMKMLTSEQAGQTDAGKGGQAGQQTGQAGQQTQAAQSIQQFLKTLNGGQSAPTAQGGQGGQAGNSELNQLLPLVFQMLKTLDSQASDDPKPATDNTASSTNSTAPSGDQKPHPTGQPAAGLQSPALRSSTGLVTHSLGNTPRMSNDEWRQLFPQQK